MPERKVTDAMREWLRGYLDGEQNGRRVKVHSVWTRGNNRHHRGLFACRHAGLITSHQDDDLHKGGWRHDLTPSGRTAADQYQADVDRRRDERKRQDDEAWETGIGIEPLATPEL